MVARLLWEQEIAGSNPATPTTARLPSGSLPSGHADGRTRAASCVLIVFDPNQRVALFWTVPFVAVCYGLHAVALRRGWVRA